MSPGVGGATGSSEAPRPARGPRNAVVAVALLVLVLVVVLAGLLGGGAEEDAGPGATASASRSTPTSAAGRSSASQAPSAGATRDAETGLRVVALSSLPRQAQQTVALIDRGGPFPYRQDGATFGNRERRLPSHPSGWYREYTVVTPGEDDRGPRRVVTGDDDRLVFYTADHYDSFVRVAR